MELVDAANLDGSAIWSYTALWSEPHHQVVRGRIRSISHEPDVDDDAIVTFVTVLVNPNEVVVVRATGMSVPLSLSLEDLPN